MAHMVGGPLAAALLAPLLVGANSCDTTTSSSSSGSAPAVASSTAAKPGEVKTITGKGAGEGDRFTLAGGSYHVEISTEGSCFYSFKLDRTDGSYKTDVGGFGGQGPSKTPDDLDNVPAGEFYINANTGPAPNCPYVMVLTQK